MHFNTSIQKLRHAHIKVRLFLESPWLDIHSTAANSKLTELVTYIQNL